jgi:TonB family protein
MKIITGQARIAVTASIAIHILIFIVLAAVKLYYGEVDAKAEMPVTFVKVQDAKPRRRSALIRPNILIYRSPQNRSQEQAIIRPAYRSSEVFYTSAPQQIFSTARGMEREALRGQFAAQMPPIDKPHRMVSPVGTAVLKETHPPETQLIPSSVTSGRDFLEEIPSIQSRPSLSQIMRRFVQTVRRRIESRKRYPLAARKSLLEGRVGVRMTILKDGRLERIEIIESSGHRILDKAALESVRRSAPFPPFPKEAERKRVHMSIYMVFKMT